MASSAPIPVAGAPVHKTVGGNAAFHNFHNDFAHISVSFFSCTAFLAILDGWMDGNGNTDWV